MHNFQSMCRPFPLMHFECTSNPITTQSIRLMVFCIGVSSGGGSLSTMPENVVSDVHSKLALRMLAKAADIQYLDS